nr:unnamed protein product [Spirometra erinaceieuropaei]
MHTVPSFSIALSKNGRFVRLSCRQNGRVDLSRPKKPVSRTGLETGRKNCRVFSLPKIPGSLKVRCSLREPMVDQTFTVPELVAEVIPGKCTYEIQDGAVIMKLYKADRSRPWALELAGNGLNSSISDNLTTDPPKNA